MDRFLKPQAPIKDKENDYIYPLTTIDQIIGDGDRRLNIILEDDFAKKDEVSSAKTEAIDSSKVYTNEQVKRAAPRNLLDNSDFRNPVNQRGQTSYSGSVYTIDRWRTWDSTASVTLNDGYLTHNEALCQYIPGLDKDKIYTLAFQEISGEVHVMSGKPSDGLTVWPGMNLFYDTTLGVCVRFWMSEGRNTKVWAALYEGEYSIDTLPGYQPKGYSVELDECRRYYQKMYIRFNGKALAVTLPVPMAAVPNISREMEGDTEPDYCYMLDNKTVDIGLYTAGDIGGYFTFEVPI